MQRSTLMQRVYQSTVAMLLNRVQQPWTAKLYAAIARQTTMIAVETVFLQRRGEVVEVLLTRRPCTDRFFANLEHSPGSIMRSTDAPGDKLQAYQSAFTRVEAELNDGASRSGELVTIRPLVFVGTTLQQTARGRELAQVILCECSGTPSAPHRWVPVGDVPALITQGKIVPHHERVIAIAVQGYK